VLAASLFRTDKDDSAAVIDDDDDDDGGGPAVGGVGVDDDKLDRLPLRDLSDVLRSTPNLSLGMTVAAAAAAAAATVAFSVIPSSPSSSSSSSGPVGQMMVMLCCDRDMMELTGLAGRRIEALRVMGL